MSDLEEPAVLLEEYKENASFTSKLGEFKRTYVAFRRVRGDGSCFYRSFCVALAEYCVNNAVFRPAGYLDCDAYVAAAPVEADATEAAQLPPDATPQARYEAWLAFVRDSLPALIKRGWSEYTAGDFRDAMLSWLWGCGKASSSGGSAPVTLDAALGPLGYRTTDAMESFYVLTYVRCLCALQLRAREDDYFPWVLALAPECASVKAFCDCHVEAVHTDADQLQIMALAQAFGVAVRIAYIDATASGSGAGSGGGLTTVTIPDEDVASAPASQARQLSVKPVVHVLCEFILLFLF